jgi:hypothetical protein
VRFDQNAHEGNYHVASEEGLWSGHGTAALGATKKKGPVPGAFLVTA